MRVLKRPAAPKPVVKTCANCKAELEIEREDCTLRRDGSYKREHYWECSCECCGKQVIVYNQAWEDAPPGRVDATAYLDK